MLPFDYRGRDWHGKNRVRRLFLELFGLLLAILVFPFVLVNALFLALWRLGSPAT